MDEQEKSLRVLAKGAGITLIGVAVSKFLSYGYRLLTARLGTSEYGQLSLGLAILNILAVLCLFGMPQAVLRYVAYYEGRQDFQRMRGTILFSLKFVLAFSIIAAAALYVSAGYISSNIFHDGELKNILKIFALVLPALVLRNNILSVFQAFKKVEYEMLARHVTENAAKIVLAAVLLYAGFGILGGAAAYAAAIVLSFALSVYFFRKVFPFKSSIMPQYEIKELIGYSLPAILNALIVLVLVWTDTFMLGYYRTTSDVGIYNAVVPTAAIIYIVPNALLVLLVPVLTNLYARQEMQAFAGVYRTINKWILAANIPLLVVFAVFPKAILDFLFGRAYIPGWSSLIVLMFGYFVYHLSWASNNVLLVLKRQKLVLLICSIGSILNIILNALLIPRYGFFGAGVATSISLLAIGALNFALAAAITRISPFKRGCLKLILSGAVLLVLAGLLLYFLQGIPASLLSLISFVSLLAAYSGLLLVTRSINREDIAILKVIMQKTGLKLDWLKPIINKFVEK